MSLSDRDKRDGPLREITDHRWELMGVVGLRPHWQLECGHTTRYLPGRSASGKLRRVRCYDCLVESESVK